MDGVGFFLGNNLFMQSNIYNVCWTQKTIITIHIKCKKTNNNNEQVLIRQAILVLVERCRICSSNIAYCRHFKLRSIEIKNQLSLRVF